MKTIRQKVLLMMVVLALSVIKSLAQSGMCGESLTWTFNDGTLTISGTGDMDDYNHADSELPWRSFSSSITTVVIEDGVTSIGALAFERCAELASITISNSVTDIRLYPFQGCTGLTSIDVASDNTMYSSEGGVLFNKTKTELIRCPEGKSGTYTIPEGVTSIGSQSFDSCVKLTSITIPNSVINIEYGAFEECRELISITIPSGVTSIGIYAFNECSRLTSINVENENNTYSSESGVLFNKTKTELILCPAGKSGSYTIPNSVINIGDEAFRNCRELALITIPSGVTSIGMLAFGSCTGLTSIDVADDNTGYSFENGILFNKTKTELVFCLPIKSGIYTIPEGVTSIGRGAFWFCTGFTSITIPEGIESIGREAFAGTQLTSITIPASVTSIEYSAFYYCDKLTSVVVNWEMPLPIDPNTFQYINNYSLSTATLTVPVGSKAAYETAEVWKDFGTIVEQSAGPIDITADFTDPNFRAAVYELINKTAPDPIYDTDVAWIAGLSVFNKSISSLNGIEHFTGLVNLDCSHNQLSSLNVGNLTNLATLDCSYNQLSSLNVGNLTNLADLQCDSNQLSSLNVSGLTNLKMLRCARNQLISLTLVDLTILSDLVCGFNQLSSLNVSNLTNLINLACDNNQISTLDVSNLTNLRGLKCENNSLSTLDISGLNQLTYLDCRQNYLTADPTGYNPSITTNYQFNPQKTPTGPCATPIASGVFGEGNTLTWTLCPDSTLTISGMGNMPDNIRPWYSFRGSITTLVIEDGITSIGAGVFTDCNLLTSITIPTGVTSIGDNAFNGCYKLISITIPASVTSIGHGAFGTCRSGIIGGVASVIVNWTTPLNISSYVFYLTDIANILLIVPQGTKSLYQAAEVWKDFGTIVEQTTASTDITASFTDANFKAAVYAEIGKTAPDPIYDTDVAGITDLDVSNKNISSMNGIEYFTGLQTLDCSYNQLSTLNVVNLTNLQILSCGNNQISALNVASLTNLAQLYCGNSQLSTLDVSNLTNLRTLSCWNNQISTLDVARLTDLTTLMCDGNRILALDVTNLVNLQILYCGDNQLSTLNVAGLIHLQEFYCSNNKLTTLDISGLNQLTTLDCRQNYLTAAPTGYNPVITTSYQFDPQKTLSSVPVTSIRLDKADLWLLVNETKQLTATVLPSNATNKNVRWSSSDESVASVSSEGLVWAVAEGTATITVTTQDGQFTATCYIIVSPPAVDVTGVSLDITRAELTEGDSLQLTATVTPEEATNKTLRWTSNNNSIATVSSDGMVTAVAEGRTAIFATTEDGGFSVYCTVTVQKNEESGDDDEGDQAVIVDEGEPAGSNGTGKIEISLEIPSDVAFTGTFRITLPNGMSIDINATNLVESLRANMRLTIMQESDGSWLFTITSSSLRSLTALSYQKIADIVYKIDESVADGKYDAAVRDVNLKFDDGTTVAASEIPVVVTVDHSYTGTPSIAGVQKVYISGNMLYVDSPVSETVSVYSVTGQLLYKAEKPAGAVQIPLGGIQNGMLIVRGGGWVKKELRIKN